MTFDEFKTLAVNPPQRHEETIFEVVEYTVEDSLYWVKKKSKYPRFDLWHYTVGFCHTYVLTDTTDVLLRKALSLGFLHMIESLRERTPE